MKYPFKKTFAFCITRKRDGKEFQGIVDGYVVPIFGIPVYVPAGGAKNIRRMKKLTKRATRLAENLYEALADLATLKDATERKFSSLTKEEEPPEQAAPDAQ